MIQVQRGELEDLIAEKERTERERERELERRAKERDRNRERYDDGRDRRNVDYYGRRQALFDHYEFKIVFIIFDEND